MDLTKVVKVKVGELGHCTLAHQNAELGDDIMVIENVPVDVHPGRVCVAFSQTILIGDGKRVRWSALGRGKLAHSY